MNSNLTKIMAYLSCDGHLYKDLSGFYLSAKSKSDLLDFEQIVFNEFGLTGKYYTHPNSVLTLRFFNSIISNYLFSLGVPRGEKVKSCFSVPDSILNNTEFARDYLKICFFCEGCKYKHTIRKEVIQICFSKHETLLEDGLHFLNSLKQMLLLFDISTTNIWYTKSKIAKKDGSFCYVIKMKVSMKDTDKFIKEIGWYR